MSSSLKGSEAAAKEAFDVEKELEKKIKLSDGSEEFIYSMGPKFSDELFPVQCYLCRGGRMSTKDRLSNHVTGLKHVNALKEALATPPNEEEYRKPYLQQYSDRIGLKNPIKIYPGETIDELTTEYVDRLLPMKEFNWDHPPAEGYVETLKSDIIMDFNQKAPLLGICYCFKFAKDKQVAYYCVLCETELTELNAYQHLKGKEHFDKYVEKHFPETMSKISKIPGNVTEDQKSAIIRIIYQKLENWKGHRPFYLVNGKSFLKSKEAKERFTSRVHIIYHYCDTTIIFSEKEIKEIYEKIKKRQIIPPRYPERLDKQPKNEDELTKLPSDVEETVPEEVKKAPNRPNSRKRRARAAKAGKETDDKDEKDKDESDNAKKSKIKLDESPANWQRYREKCQRAIQNLNVEYERFFAISERHPRYETEWRYYYKNKISELRAQRINPNNYNFKPEWNEYWMRYLQRCFKRDVEKCKHAFRKVYKLPFRGRTPEPQNASADGKNQSGPIPLMSLGSLIPTNNSGNNITGNIFGMGGNVSNKPLASIFTEPTPQQQQIQQQRQTQQVPDVQQKNQQSQQQNGNNNEPTSVLGVLRVLTALENELGSLGPTAVQLLAKAILYEKESKQSANELLHETEYFTLLATSLEKLKGLITASLLPDLKIQAVKNCINDIEKLLALFEEYLQRNPDSAKHHVSSSIVLRNKLPAQEPETVLPIKSNNNQALADNFMARPTNSGLANDSDQWNISNRGGGGGNDQWNVNNRGGGGGNDQWNVNNRGGGGGSDMARGGYSDNNQGGLGRNFDNGPNVGNMFKSGIDGRNVQDRNLGGGDMRNDYQNGNINSNQRDGWRSDGNMQSNNNYFGSNRGQDNIRNDYQKSQGPSNQGNWGFEQQSHRGSGNQMPSLLDTGFSGGSYGGGGNSGGGRNFNRR